MDWGLYDQESAIRQRYLELDDRTEAIKTQIGRKGWRWGDFQQLFDISWIYHENGLEGSVLTFAEIKSAVGNQIISDVSLLGTYRGIRSQKRCIDTIRERAGNRRFTVSIEFLKQLHGSLVADAKDAGVYRRDIPIHRTYFHEIAQPAKIETALQEVLDYLHARHEQDLHGIELAANVHHRFMRVFPFSSHSGMIGRLLLNFVLVRCGCVPAIIHAADRQRYYEALRGSERDFRGFLVEVLENSLENAKRFLAQRQRQALQRAV